MAPSKNCKQSRPESGAALAMVAVMAATTIMSPLLQSVQADVVIIENDIPGMVLEVQCFGGKRDLGYQTIYSRLSYSFSFSPGWWGRDVYTCEFHAQGFPLKRMLVYEGNNFFDNFCLCRTCHWTVSTSGFDCEHGQYQERW